MKLAPSILAADFTRLGEEMQRAEAAGADRFHIDVMDGVFVPNISFGIPVVKSIRKASKLPFEVHLMIENADDYLQAFVDAGADSLIVHQETLPHLHRTLQTIRGLGKGVGVAINPGTPISVLDAVLADVDLVLVMTVNPGFGGQSFIRSALDKIRQLKARIDEINPEIEIEVDGGIDPSTAPLAYEAGAEVLVAGSAVFSTPDSVADASRRIFDAVSVPG